MKPAFLIAAPHSGSGKTTVVRGLMALYRRKGYTVQPFKCGPDYIDTKFHAAVCGRPSVNLDSYFASPEHLRQLFNHYTEGADVAIVEGMMGLFDGYDRDRGSSAEIARWLGLPVLLVVDARSAAYSMAALLQGFLNFRPDVRFLGVLFNKVGSDRHAQMLREVAREVGIPCLGCLPKRAELETASRYLGLDFNLPLPPPKEGALSLEEILEEHIEWENLLSEERRVKSDECKLHSSSCEQSDSNSDSSLFTLHSSLSNILVARNAESFSFLYQEVLDRLATLGPVEYFDPEEKMVNGKWLNGKWLYLPGGYPEKHLEALARNEAVRRAIHEYAEGGGRIVAECGGMMYLCQSIVTDDGEYPMCGVLPYRISARQADRRLSLGYRRFMLGGREFRGHEFHYTQVVGGSWETANPDIRLISVTNAKGELVPTPVIRYKNVLASYTHLYDVAGAFSVLS